MYTIDASVHISALNPREADCTTSRTFLELVRERRLALFSPTLLLVEVAVAAANALGDIPCALRLSEDLSKVPNQILIPLDTALAERAAKLAATARLRGADAVYAAVAQQCGTTLVTLDQQQLERLAPLVRIARPADALHVLATAGQPPTE